jgi:DNA-binding transcriptional regulator LsrR (DeoR family)
MRSPSRGRTPEEPASGASADRSETLSDRKLELAARAAWLYHAKGRRQDQIAAELNVSRQIVQRLVALAASENLIRFQLIHPLSECIELAERLREAFDLVYCEVAPASKLGDGDIETVATAAALYLENLLSQKAPTTVAIGNGQAMRETANRVPLMNRPQHKCISLRGNLTRYGWASHYDVVMRLAERISAQCYPVPMPVVTNTIEERAFIQAQPAYKSFLSLIDEATVLMMGMGYIDWQAPLHLDGHITDLELGEAMQAGAVGEVLGHSFNSQGQLLEGGYHDRLTSYRLAVPAKRTTMIVQTGSIRVAAIRAALNGRIANSLITDEQTARLLLDLQKR